MIWSHLGSSEISLYFSRFINELLEISSDENSFFSQELSAGKDSSFLLEDNGHGHLVYIPSQMVEPKILANNYDSDQGPTANAGKEIEVMTEILRSLGPHTITVVENCTS